MSMFCFTAEFYKGIPPTISKYPARKKNWLTSELCSNSHFGTLQVLKIISNVTVTINSEMMIQPYESQIKHNLNKALKKNKKDLLFDSS